jgi:hypothetical protein
VALTHCCCSICNPITGTSAELALTRNYPRQCISWRCCYAPAPSTIHRLSLDCNPLPAK